MRLALAAAKMADETGEDAEEGEKPSVFFIEGGGGESSNGSGAGGGGKGGKGSSRGSGSGGGEADAAGTIKAGIGERYGADALAQLTVVGSACDAPTAAAAAAAAAAAGVGTTDVGGGEDAVLLRIPIAPLSDGAFQDALTSSASRASDAQNSNSDGGGGGGGGAWGIGRSEGLAALDIPLKTKLINALRSAAAAVDVAPEVGGCTSRMQLDR
jgi:hypothetical protein